MANRLSDTEIWTKDWFLDLNSKQKLLVKFLFDNCDCAGFYKISWRLLKFYFYDVEITKEDFKKIKQVKFIEDDLIFIEDFALFQCKVSTFEKLNPNNNAHKGVLKLLDKYGIFKAPSEGLVSPFNGAQDKDKDKEIEKDIKLYGEYLNVCLDFEQYGKLLSMCASEKLLNELIDSFSINIEIGKERPYEVSLPNAHFERLKSYYNFRRKHPDKFAKEVARPDSKTYKPEALIKNSAEDEAIIKALQAKIKSRRAS